jgi:hypothetical protein
MDGYRDAQRGDIVSALMIEIGPPGAADVSIQMDAGTGQHRVELSTRVSPDDVPSAIDDLMACVMFDQRAALLARLTEKWAR